MKTTFLNRIHSLTANVFNFKTNANNGKTQNEQKDNHEMNNEMNNEMFLHKNNSFAAWVLRLKNIIRWPLMHSIRPEQCSTHSFEVAVTAHIIAVIGVKKFNRTYTPADFMVAGAYHEASESAGVSDVPSPVKYANPNITREIKKLEDQVERSLVYNGLPEYLQSDFESIVIQKMIDPTIKGIVKAADNIAAYLKAREELNLNNLEFLDAEQNLKKRIIENCKQYPEVKEYVNTQMQMCMMSLDGLTSTSKSVAHVSFDETISKAS